MENENRSIFRQNEKVLCYHDKLLYEAKVCGFKFDKRAKENVYQIHFIGWSKKWDIWSKENNILRWNRENLKKKDELMMTQENPNQGKKRNALERKRAKTDIADTDEISSADEVYIYDLSNLCWDLLEKDAQLSSKTCCARYFPSSDSNSIKSIFSEFCEFRYSGIDSISDKTESQKTYLKSEVVEFITGLGRFFDTMFPLQLLYKYDDPLPVAQAADTCSRPISSCSILHLLRFLSRLQPNIQEILQNNDCANTLKPLFQSFLDWLEEKIQKFNDNENFQLLYKE